MKSKLFVPASRPELFDKAMASAADAISFDLEDAVAPERKAEARATLAAWLRQQTPGQHAKKIIVRINASDTPYYQDDLTELGQVPFDILNVPKTESAASVRDAVSRASAAGFTGRFLVNVETPQGLARAAELAAAHERVCGLQLGLADLFEPLGIARYDMDILRPILLAVRLAAGASGKFALDAAYARVKDTEGFRAEAQLARSIGFLGKSCIHPSQIAIANEAFSFSADEIEEARRVVAASEAHAGVGAFVLDGRMIDAPFVRRAQDVLLAAGPA